MNVRIDEAWRHGHTRAIDTPAAFRDFDAFNRPDVANRWSIDKQASWGILLDRREYSARINRNECCLTHARFQDGRARCEGYRWTRPAVFRLPCDRSQSRP